MLVFFVGETMTHKDLGLLKSLKAIQRSPKYNRIIIVFGCLENQLIFWPLRFRKQIKAPFFR